jgi:glycosyltransferase involved in cell wall biosynthesis
MLTAAGIPQEDVMPFVRCYGRVAHEKALKVVAGCSYTVLLRPLNRTSQAGFPTKVVESASLGVPVIANATSDIFDCLELNEQAFLVDEPTSKSLAVTLASLIARGSGFAWGLRGSVRAAARSRFDYRSRSSELSDFMLQATS